jgi:hypothetical protein
MRFFQIMRYGRRTILTVNELAQSSNLTPMSKRRSSTFTFSNEHRQNSIQYEETDNVTVHR